MLDVLRSSSRTAHSKQAERSVLCDPCNSRPSTHPRALYVRVIRARVPCLSCPVLCRSPGTRLLALLAALVSSENIRKRTQEVLPDMVEFMKTLRERITVGVVGGSDLPKQKEQLGDSGAYS